MRSAALLLFVWLLTGTAFAETQELDCTQCRDIRTYPEDFGNFAFNVKVAMVENSQTPYNAEVVVWNPAGQWGRVNLARVMESSGLSFYIPPLFGYQIPFPSPYMRISVQDEYGTLTTYQVLVNSSTLKVGDGTQEQTVDDSPEDPVPEPNKQGLGGEAINWTWNYGYGVGGSFPIFNVYKLSNE